MSIFGKYSSYYDLINKDKDYLSEVEYIHELIQKHNPGADSILDLGCGTGNHDFFLKEKGYKVTGIDNSKEMLSVAKSKITSKSSTLKFVQGDIRNVRLGKQYDVIISLFHAMSYQITNEDLMSVFETAKFHLKEGGVFIFDCWYGPAVLTDRPSVRVKRLEDDSISIVRVAEPTMFPNENRVDVNYDILIKNKASGLVEEVKETHRMRYLFKPEIDFVCDLQGFKLVSIREWMTGNEPGFESWGVCMVCGLS